MKEEKPKNKYACFFGGAQNNTESIEYKESVLIGELLNKKGYIIKNGGYRGLMEAVSRGSFTNGGIVEGYTCIDWKNTTSNSFLTKNIKCTTLFERLEKLINNTDLFIIQKGGIGTISELFLTLDFIRKLPKERRPKIYLIGYHWQKLKDSLLQMDLGDEINLLKIIRDFKQFRETL
ncbi:LOG family protein [Chryseobacterium taeanense]|uniref:LOG family protein n=1 Tax=Chryseobacterium taeanense TaxID=311334 RepID=UPI0035B0E112